MNKSVISVLLASLLIAGCASERVVLLPSVDGRPGAVVVRDTAGEVRLDKPYAATRRNLGVNDAYQSSPEEVSQRFGDALAARPARPLSYVLYFEAGGNVLTGALLASIRQASGHDGPLTIYGEASRIGTPRLKAEGVTFKQTPYDVKAR